MPYILVVDDSLDASEALCAYLQKVGFEADCKPNGREALMSLLARVPDLIVLDLYMPELSGGGLLEVIRSYIRLQYLPVIIWTALPDSPMIDRVRFLNANTILAKGKASLADIEAAIRQELPSLSA